MENTSRRGARESATHHHTKSSALSVQASGDPLGPLGTRATSAGEKTLRQRGLLFWICDFGFGIPVSKTTTADLSSWTFNLRLSTFNSTL